jgi:hypothetical protein
MLVRHVHRTRFKCLSLVVLEHFDELRLVHQRRYATVVNLHLAASGLVRDRGYPSLHNFAAIEADPDAGA